MQTCPNCDQPTDVQRTVCPNCGETLPGQPMVPTPGVWPPPPMGFVPAPPPAPPRLLTGNAGRDVVLGFLTTFGGCVASVFLVFIPFLGAIFSLMILALGLPILYVVQQKRYPFYARGIGWGIIAYLAIGLGAITLCFYSLANEGRH